MTDVYNAAGKFNGEYSKDRVVGSETFRILKGGASEGARELAIARGNWVDYAVRLANIDIVTTDGIRYALDEFRELDAEDIVPAEDMHRVVEYLRKTNREFSERISAPKSPEPDSQTRQTEEFELVRSDFFVGIEDQRIIDTVQHATERHWKQAIQKNLEYISSTTVAEWMNEWATDWPDGDDPRDTDPPNIYGEEIESTRNISVFVSDLHMSDGTAGGDDFLTPHLAQQANGLLAGGPGVRSKTTQFAQMIIKVQSRILEVFGSSEPFDLILNGDIFDQLEMMGRGSNIGAQHRGFFSICAALEAQGNQVHYIRGNHDFRPPPGPWKIGEAYSNITQKVFAEHGDQYDKSNWPPGTGSNGAKTVIGGLSAGVPGLASLEVLSTSLAGAPAKFWMAGLDNVRPFTDIATMLSLRNSLGILGTVQDPIDLAQRLLDSYSLHDKQGDQKGAARRRNVKGNDWLMVQGHTHVPIALPGKFYNTGTWTPIAKVLRSYESHWFFWTTARPTGVEAMVSIDPFLLTYVSPNDGNRVEEFYTIGTDSAGNVLRIEQRSPSQINALHRNIYSDTPGAPLQIIPELQGP